MKPTAGLIDHVTAVFDELATVAVNCWACDAASVNADGLTVTPTGG